MTINIDTFYNSVVSGSDKYYVYVGTPDPTFTPINIQDNIVFAKRVVANDVTYAIKNNPWIYNTVYTPYTYTAYNNGSLTNFPFYVWVHINGIYKIFKCLDNNLGVPSTVSPAAITRYNPTTLDDGYTWIYMYQVDGNTFTKYTNNDYIPIIIDTVSAFYASPGTIDCIQLVNGGYGYTFANITITGDGVGATASAEINNGKITKIIVNNVGTSVYTTATINIIGDGSGAQANAVIPPSGGHASNQKAELFCHYLIFSTKISNKEDYVALPYGVKYASYGLLKNVTYANYTGDMAIDYVTVTNGGVNYRLENKPTIGFSGGFDSDQISHSTNFTASAYASMSLHSLTRVVLLNNGLNYRAAPTVSASGGDGSGITLSSIMKATPIKTYYSLNVKNVNRVFRDREIIKQGSVTAQVLFHDTINNIVGLYNISGTFVGNTIINGLSSGASATTNTTSFLNTPDITFNSGNVYASYNGATITRQIYQPETISITLSF